MDLKQRLQMIMEQEFGITTDKQLDEAFEKLDLSVYGVFTQKGVRNEKRDVSVGGGFGVGVSA